MTHSQSVPLEPYELLDHSCPDATAQAKAIEAEVVAQKMGGEAEAMEALRRVNLWAVDHKRSCRRCQSYQPAARDGRSPVWGGATLGLLVGLVAGFFRHEYWATVLVCVLGGTLLGLASNVIAAAGSRIR